MHRIDTSDAAAGGQFKKTPAPATTVTPDWLNDVQGNICEVIEGAGLVLDKGEFGQLLEAIRRMGARPGTITQWGGATVPDGALECDGAEVLIAAQPALYAAIGDTWGAAAALHFKLPDLRGRFWRGWDNGAGRDPARDLGSYQDDDNKSHSHVVGELDPEGRSDAGSNNLVPDGSGFGNVTSATSGGAEARPKNAAGMFIIQT